MNEQKSLPLISYYLSSKKNSNSYSISDFSFLAVFKMFPSKNSLDCILDGLSLCAENNQKFVTRKKELKYPDVYIGMLSGLNNKPIDKERKVRIRHEESSYRYIPKNIDRLKWKEVILSYLKNDLPQWQKNFLDDVLEAIDEQGGKSKDKASE